MHNVNNEIERSMTHRCQMLSGPEAADHALLQVV